MTFVHKYENAFSEDLCDRLVEFFESKTDIATDNEFEGRSDRSIFCNEFQSFGQNFKDEVDSNLRQCYEETISHYNDIHRDYELVVNDTYKLQKSVAGGGFTSWHTEQGSSESTRSRFGVWMVYLNDCDSGYTEFKYIDLKAKPQKGTCLIWPASYTHCHRAAPDLKEDKYILTGWFSYNDAV